MFTPATLLHVLVAAYRLVVALWNACTVFLQVMRSMMQEAKQDAAKVMALLDDGASMMDTITSASLLLDASGPANPWQMLIIARASSFVLLVRLSPRRVLHLEVDEMFITTKLEVICTELMLHVQHVPRLLQMPIGVHDTRLVKYTPMKLPYVWKEEHVGSGCGGERSIVPPAPAPSVSEGHSRRKKYVQLLTESALRRRLHMDRLGRVGLEAAPKRGAKAHGVSVVKRQALANATNMGMTRAEDVDEAHGLEAGAAETPKQVRMERSIHAALSENLSIPNMAQARTTLRSWRKRDLYAQGIPSEFSWLSNTNQ